MNNFAFHNPTRIFFGKGQIARLPVAIPNEAVVLLLYGGGSIKRNGVYDQVREALSGRRIVEFGGIEANPTYETLMNAVEVARREGASYLLSVGGGSVLDGTKFVAAAVPFAGDPWDLVVKRARIREALPIGAVLTLPATGSEMNGSAVISRRDPKAKLAFFSPHVYPTFSILDPETTYSLPRRQLANGIIDAFSHVLEQYLTYPSSAPLQDRFAESILLSLIEIAPRVLEKSDDYESRATFMWCATLALNGLIGAGVPQDWSTHAIGHELTALYGIDHARSLAAVIPGLLDAQRVGKREKLLQYAERIWGIVDGDDDARIDAGIRRTADFFDDLGAPSKLKAYPDVGSDAPEMIARRLAARGVLPMGERQDIDEARVVRILEASLR